ncbi:unnamed protein product [Lactuca virosa]|uniref:Uncharacterized protein n=1 Tax=Lactuca virosa TaxID=75947 RepID=A0AAU9PSU9_9ASTR|nr:unnamed protein product [Lactuca virosa]
MRNRKQISWGRFDPRLIGEGCTKSGEGSDGESEIVDRWLRNRERRRYRPPLLMFASPPAGMKRGERHTREGAAYFHRTFLGFFLISGSKNTKGQQWQFRSIKGIPENKNSSCVVDRNRYREKDVWQPPIAAVNLMGRKNSFVLAGNEDASRYKGSFNFYCERKTWEGSKIVECKVMTQQHALIDVKSKIIEQSRLHCGNYQQYEAAIADAASLPKIAILDFRSCNFDSAASSFISMFGFHVPSLTLACLLETSIAYKKKSFIKKKNGTPVLQPLVLFYHIFEKDDEHLLVELPFPLLLMALPPVQDMKKLSIFSIVL